ncbi:ATP-binding cassette domain-containing protein [Pseudalkalibacillus salsuginis]|uniref:ATP-binding cassette domain-containing protein n=1 Tax=Pseudalkalibacillus salsuginis TaxID=2910972 RepID=UPI001F2152ED|nr:ATP-binding cassette domain-containing protein [Pseudalkalibacillus salsuginis]MCF6410353.1 ATP-binding cassette domain-containing protein [Pseudalkalibacillus salsuginis]
MNKLVEVQNLSTSYHDGINLKKAIEGVSFYVYEGETLGIVGESGSGKTTLARTILRILQPDYGLLKFDGEDISKLTGKKLREMRKDFQMIFQNPYESLSPRLRVGDILEEPLVIQKMFSPEERTQKAYRMLENVGLAKSSYHKTIHEFSGGQRQRIAIARALVMNPRLIIADEPVSALDVSVQAQILNLLKDLQKEFNLTTIFISHDLSVVHHMSDRVAILNRGHLLEIAGKEEIYKEPIHPYTKSLLSSIPRNDPAKRGETEEKIEVPPLSPHPPHLIHIGNEHYVAADVIEIKHFEVQK